MPAIVVLTTAPDAATARKLARRLVERKLAACVSCREGWTSIYRWKGKVERARETLLVIKTAERRFAKLAQEIETLHPYDVPEIVALPVKRGARKYLSWLESEVR